MTVQEVARGVMKVTGTSQTEVANRAGLTGQSTVSMYLQSKSMRVENLLTILNACGYELVARSADGRLPEFVIGERLCMQESVDDIVRKAVAEALANRSEGTPGNRR